MCQDKKKQSFFFVRYWFIYNNKNDKRLNYY